MTKPPTGGSGAARDTAEFGAITDSAEFGATTISGKSDTDDDSSPERTGPTSPRTSEPDSAEPPQSGTAGSPTSRPSSAAAGPAAFASALTPTDESATTRGTRAGGRSRGPRRARLQIRHINPMTVLKFSCVLAIALFFVWLIVIGVLYGVLDGAGVINSVNTAVTKINGTGSKAPITAGIVFGGAAIVGVINIVLFIALTTIGAVIYNLCADLVGGIEVTLSER